MRELVNIKSYDVFMGDLLNEDLIHGDQNYCNKAFKNMGPLKFGDKQVMPEEIINVVQEALRTLNDGYRKTFQFAQRTMNIIYLPHSAKVPTMCVDEHMNLYLNAEYVYNNLKMDSDLVAAVIMHEVLHVLYDHIERGINWLSAKGKERTPQTWHDINLAADVEVNRTVVKIDVVSSERLVNEIHGMYLEQTGEKMGSHTIVPMEMILENEEYMNMLRQMCPPPVDPTQSEENKETIHTSDEWNQGYKDAWNKVAKLIKEYGAQETWNKLLDAGIINGAGEIVKNKIKDLNSIQYLTVKTYEDFLNENNDTEETQPGQTYEDGYNTAFAKVVNAIKNALEGGGGGKGPKGPSGPTFKSDLKDEDLDEIELPEPPDSNGDDDDDQDENENEIPQNIKQRSKSGKGKGKKGFSRGYGGSSQEDTGSSDKGEMADDLAKNGGDSGTTISDETPEFENGSNGQSGSSQGKSGSSKQNEDEIGVGGTGGFLDKPQGDDILKDAGYSEEQISEINKVRKSNELHNSKEKLKKEINRTRRELEVSGANRIIGKYLNTIEKEAEKYRNVWKKILEEFLANKTRRAGADTPTGYNDWRNRNKIARGEYGIHHQMESQDPQDINVYVDVSGSIDIKLLEVITKSLVVFTQEWEYSGINIACWANRSSGIVKIKDFYEKSEEEVTKEIMSAIDDGCKSCGGGTDSRAATAAMLDGIQESLSDEDKDEKDDVHIVITDGYFDYQNMEAKIGSAVRSTFNRPDLAEIVPSNTVWMLYDTDEAVRQQWVNEIKKGKLIFLNTEVVKNNG